MKLEPTIAQKEARTYVAIASKVKMRDIPAELPPHIQEVYAWLTKSQITPAGPPFFHYLSLNPDTGLLEVEVGFPTSHAVAGNERIRQGVFPAGQYLVATHRGSYNGLPQVHAAIEKWSQANGINFKGTRAEFYPTDPAKEPNPEHWITEVELPLAEV